MNKRFPILDYLPQNFPSKIYEEIYDKILKYKGNFELQYGQFAGGWRSLVYRYLACMKHNNNYINIVKKYGISPCQPFRYEQERELFNFFTNGLSAIETLGYMTYMICSLLKPNVFELNTKNDLENITLYRTIQKLKNQKTYSQDRLTKELSLLFKSNEFNNWRKIRNTLMHRETPGRIIQIGVGSSKKPRKDLWFDGKVELDEYTTKNRLNWLENNINNVIMSINLFVNIYL